ncbi:hypothetical protein [Nostoc sp. DedQUE03]|uniref:hypothetical protein n=1 Tax=Nostoc sp. DedQUE03 TaxID=3075389 RepID=UPI002AD8D56B|nr:hypothetical protein [Nostoc sp. DedQUE03]MDZ8043971.1 hypothetical protein [Nostoc sp. DedQUE02]
MCRDAKALRHKILTTRLRLMGVFESAIAAISALLGELKKRMKKLHKCSIRLS